MKKLLSLFLAVILIFSCMAIPASAARPNIVGELALDFFSKLTGTDISISGDGEEPVAYGIIYQMDSGGVAALWTPTPTMNFDGPGTFTLTSDVPLAVDYEFLCWEDEDDNRYYPGDQLFVNGQVRLYAVWIPKTDNDIRIIRVIKTSMEALNRLFKKFLKIFNTATDSFENFVPTDPTNTRYCNLTCTDVYYERDGYSTTANDPNDQGQIFIYVDPSAALAKGLSRKVDSGKCTIYFCTDWKKRTAEPINKVTYDNIGFNFSIHQGAGGYDLIKISGINLKDTAYADSLEADDTEYYMVVTIPEGVYYSEANGDRVYPISSNPISYVFTLTK